MTIPYRHQEILQTLADHQKGLTTGDIFKIASSKIGSEIPDSSTVGKILYTMRNSSPKSITSSDAVGGAIHKITPHGLQQLADTTGEATQAASKECGGPLPFNQETTGVVIGIDPANNPDRSAHSITSALNLLQNAGYTILDPENEIDTAFTTIIEYIRVAETVQPAPTVARKPVKIDTLKRLGALMSDDIKTVFDDIVADIEQLDDAA